MAMETRTKKSCCSGGGGSVSDYAKFLRPQTDEEKIIAQWQKKRDREKDNIIAELKHSIALFEEQVALYKDILKNKQQEIQAWKDSFDGTAPEADYEADDKTLCLAPSISMLQIHKDVMNELDEIRDKYGKAIRTYSKFLISMWLTITRRKIIVRT